VVQGAQCCQTPLPVGLARNYCCPAGSQCSTQGCTPVHPEYPCGPTQGENCTVSYVCAPGPLAWSPTPGIPNIVVIGDSVSIGWTPALRALVGANATGFNAYVTHSPASGDGGARSTSDILQCWKYRVSTATLDPLPLTKNDYVLFNAGLHDYNLGPAGVEQYTQQLTNITARLKQTVSAKLLFVGTTPAHNTPNPADNPTVELLNTAAKSVMSAANIPFLDLYAAVTQKCGGVPWADQGPIACPLCAPKCKALSVHYTPAGYNFIASHILEAIQKL
jgi:lysophospholipase L1-like esterase